MAESVSLIELIWTGIAVIAIGFTAWIIDDNTRNFLAVRAAVREGWATVWGPRYWVAVASLVSSIAMFVVWVGFATIGVIAMTVSPHQAVDERATVSHINGVILVCMTLILAAIQVWQVYARTKIRPLVQVTESDVQAVSQQAHLTAEMVDALQTTDAESARREP